MRICTVSHVRAAMDEGNISRYENREHWVSFKNNVAYSPPATVCNSGLALARKCHQKRKKELNKRKEICEKLPTFRGGVAMPRM